MNYLAKVAVATSTFAIGITAFCINIGLTPVPDNSAVESGFDAGKLAAIPVAVCELHEKSGKFVGKSVVVEATVYAVDDYIIVHEILGKVCGYHIDSAQWDPFVLTTLDLTDYFGPNQDLKYLLREKKPFSEIDVRITGTVKRLPKNDNLLYYTIEPETIEVISPWREFEPKGAS
jgi:hypothetical protein